jgi:tryptophanyl-tRNA synthetase
VALHRRSGLGDSVVKRRLDGVLQALLAPIRESRRALARDPAYLLHVIAMGSMRARELTDRTLCEVCSSLGLFALN